MNEQSMLNKKAWEYRTYEAWLQRDGQPQEKALKILENPIGCLKLHQQYFQAISGLSIANICGSNGRKAVPLALLGADVTVFDISEGNKKYAMELAEAAKVHINYYVTDIYDIDISSYKDSFDILYLEGGILHYFFDIDKFMNILYTILKPGGKMILNDSHPFRKMMSSNPSKDNIRDYFDTGIHEADVAYKSFLNFSDNEDIPNCSLRLYNISEIINSVIKQKFILKEFNEYPSIYNEKVPGEFTIYAIK